MCGGANNQLAEARHDAALAVRGILFVPDYLSNAGGVIDFHQETIDDRPDAVLASVTRIGVITRDVLRRATETGVTPLRVADAIVRRLPARKPAPNRRRRRACQWPVEGIFADTPGRHR